MWGLDQKRKKGWEFLLGLPGPVPMDRGHMGLSFLASPERVPPPSCPHPLLKIYLPCRIQADSHLHGAALAQALSRWPFCSLASCSGGLLTYDPLGLGEVSMGSVAELEGKRLHAWHLGFPHASCSPRLCFPWSQPAPPAPLSRRCPCGPPAPHL